MTKLVIKVRNGANNQEVSFGFRNNATTYNSHF